MLLSQVKVFFSVDLNRNLFSSWWWVSPRPWFSHVLWVLTLGTWVSCIGCCTVSLPHSLSEPRAHTQSSFKGKMGNQNNPTLTLGCRHARWSLSNLRKRPTSPLVNIWELKWVISSQTPHPGHSSLSSVNEPKMVKSLSLQGTSWGYVFSSSIGLFTQFAFFPAVFFIWFIRDDPQ